jgi:molecular chaperone HscB
MSTTATTHFNVLGLPVRFALDVAELERNYLAHSRAVHPDFHQQGSVAEQQTSTQMSAALNDAYTTLKQPYRRAEYLLGLLGGPSAAEVRDMSPAFLDEMLDLRMEIEEIRETQPVDSPAHWHMQQQLTRRSETFIQELGESFARLEQLPATDPGRRAILVQVRQTLNSAKYIQGLLRDLRAD